LSVRLFETLFISFPKPLNLSLALSIWPGILNNPLDCSITNNPSLTLFSLSRLAVNCATAGFLYSFSK